MQDLAPEEAHNILYLQIVTDTSWSNMQIVKKRKFKGEMFFYVLMSFPGCHCEKCVWRKEQNNAFVQTQIAVEFRLLLGM